MCMGWVMWWGSVIERMTGAGYFTPKSEYQVHALNINWGCKITYALGGEHLWQKGGVIVERVCGWEHKNECGRGLASENEN
jgi:hypothetical protein